MKFEYLLVLAATVFFPLIRIAHPHLPIRHNLPALVKTILLVSVPFWIWDVVAAMRGHWSFHPDRVLSIRILGLPVEEFLFFPVIVYVSVFVWEAVLYFGGKWK